MNAELTTDPTICAVPPPAAPTASPLPITPPLTVRTAPLKAASSVLEPIVTLVAVRVPPTAWMTDPDTIVVPLIALLPAVASTNAFFVVCSLPPRIVPPTRSTCSFGPETSTRPVLVLLTVALWMTMPAPVPDARMLAELTRSLSMKRTPPPVASTLPALIAGDPRDVERKSVVGVDRAAASHRQLARDQADPDDRAAARSRSHSGWCRPPRSAR